MWFLYILECKDKSLYTGITTDVERRIQQHNKGIGSKAVRSKRPAHLVYQEKHQSRSKALRREAAIKNLTHTQKLQIIQSHDAKFTN